MYKNRKPVAAQWIPVFQLEKKRCIIIYTIHHEIFSLTA